MTRWAWALLLIVTACGSPPPPIVSDPAEELPLDRRTHVRVGLLVDVDQAAVSTDDEVEVRDVHGRLLARLKSGRGLTAAATPEGLSLSRQGVTLWSDAQLDLVQLRSGSLWSAKENQYGGEMIVRRAGPARVSLINLVQMEEYLRGVVPWEIGRPDVSALEAVKAQAIAARTYTYSHLDHWNDQGFDVFDTVTDQVYRGRTGVHDLTDRAVRETAGRVATHRGRLIRAYYSSTCGGHGSTLSDVWTREPAVYLRGTRDADGDQSWCADSPHFRWSTSWTGRQLGDIIRTHLPGELNIDPQSIGALLGLEILDRDRSGRVRRLQVRTDRGDFELFGDRIRWVLRPASGRFGILRSTLFNLEPIVRDGRLVAVRAHGGGFGHGVGMCQTGALGRARGGQSADEILAHYYPGARVTRLPAALPAR